MKINFQKLELHRPEVKMSTNGATIGSILRWQRKNRNLTLNEGSEGICSISYLSKVENNLIDPSEEILTNLKRRLDLEVFIDYDLKKFGEIYEDVIESLFNFKNISSMYYTLYKKNQDYKSKLIVYAYHVDSKNIERAKHLYNELEAELSKFDLIEMNLFLYLTALLLMHQGLYFNAVKVINMSKHDNESGMMSLLTKTIKLYLLLRLSRIMQAQELYFELSAQLIKEEYFEQYKKVKYQVVLFALSEVDYQSAANIIERLRNYSKTEKQFLELVLNTIHKRSDLNNRFLSNIEKDELWYLLVLINFDINEDFKAINNAINIKPNFDKTELIKNLEFFLIQKYTLDHEAFLRYIRMFSKNVTERYNGVLFIDLLLSNAASYFEKQSFYKTSNGIRKYKKLITGDLKMTLE